jgi:hypothetical protein
MGRPWQPCVVRNDLVNVTTIMVTHVCEQLTLERIVASTCKSGVFRLWEGTDGGEGGGARGDDKREWRGTGSHLC